MVDDGKSILPDAPPVIPPASVSVGSVLTRVPLRIRFWWWLLNKMNITSVDAFLGLVDNLGKNDVLLKQYLEYNDKAWKNQNKFNGMVKDILNIADANSKPREKELNERGVYQ